MKYIFAILLFILFSCDDSSYHREYFSNGSLKCKVLLDENGMQNGLYEEYYETGELFKRTYYTFGEIKDTIYLFNKNGILKEKGLLYDNKLKKGWWLSYDRMGNLKNKSEYKIFRDSIYKNQSIHYSRDGIIDKNKSSYFTIKISDTLKIGKNIGHLSYNSNFNNAEDKILSVVIKNEYSDSEIKLDTFGDAIDKTWFGVYAHESGFKTIKGEIIETLFYKRKISKDSFDLVIKEHKKYFERNVYVKDSVR